MLLLTLTMPEETSPLERRIHKNHPTVQSVYKE